MNLYSRIALDYLLGLKYSEIEKKYKVNQGYIQYALEKAGIKTNRIKSRPRLPYGQKKRKLRSIFRRNKEYKYPLFTCSKKDDNPVHIVDDLDIMERMNDVDGIDDFIENDPNLRYEIIINEEGEVRYSR